MELSPVFFELFFQDVVTENEFEKKLLADVIPPTDIGVTFDDIGALENVKDTLKELVLLLLLCIFFRVKVLLFFSFEFPNLSLHYPPTTMSDNSTSSISILLRLFPFSTSILSLRTLSLSLPHRNNHGCYNKIQKP